jgi:hypothetical protein
MFRNIFAKNGEHEGLLSGAPGVNISSLVEECVEEKEKGQRWSAVDSLVSILTGEVLPTTGQKLRMLTLSNLVKVTG